MSASEIVETGSDSVNNNPAIGSQIAYTLTVTNSGNAAATGVTITDTLPAGVSVVANLDGGGGAGNTVTWSGLTVAAGGSASVSITLQTD